MKDLDDVPRCKSINRVWTECGGQACMRPWLDAPMVDSERESISRAKLGQVKRNSNAAKG